MYWRPVPQLWHGFAFLPSMWMADSTNNPAISLCRTGNARDCTVQDFISVSRVTGKALESINQITDKNFGIGMVLHKQLHNASILYALQKRKKPLIFNFVICPDVRENKTKFTYHIKDNNNNNNYNS